MLKIVKQTAALLDKGERPQVLVIVFLMLGSVLLETVGVALIFPLVRILVDPDWVIKFPPLSYAYHLLGFDEPRHFLAACALGFLAVIIFKSAYNAVLIAYQERLCHQISSRVGSRLLARYFRDPWKDHLQRNSADMISVADVMSGWPLTNALRAYPVLVTESLVSVVLLVMLLLVAAQPALVSIAIFGIALLLSHNLVRRRLMALSGENARLGSARIQHLQESLASIKEIRMLGCEDRFIDAYTCARQRDASTLTRLLVWQNIPRALVEPMAVGAMTAAILAISTNPQTDPSATAAVLGLFAVAGVRLTPSLTRVLVAANSIRASGAPLDIITSELAVPVVAEVSRPAPQLAALKVEIQFESITFHYPGKPAPVLEQLSFRIGKGETIGLMGPSGSGKSTIADLFTGLLSPDTGSIRVDGVNIDRDIKGWQQQIGYIPQTVSLIDATLSENIALGIDPRDVDRVRMAEAITLAQLEGVVRKMPLDARLGERGVLLSGGERQRIGIARALYYGRSILVMDEATSALDSETETEIGEALARLHGQYTILIIAHRLSTMRLCDRVLFLSEGRIAVCGSPREMESRFVERVALQPD